MKINIQKLQSGGGLFYSSVLYNNKIGAKSSTGGAAAEPEIPEVLSETAQNNLSNNGLHVDVDRYYAAVARFETSAARGRVSRSELYHLKSLANTVFRQAEHYSKAMERAKDNEALSDVAVDQNGYLYAVDRNNKIKKVSFSQFNAKNERALSVAELLEAREWNPDLAYDSNSINVIGNSIGISKILDYIVQIMEKIANAEDLRSAQNDLATIVGKDLAKVPTAKQQEVITTMYHWVQLGQLGQMFQETELVKSKDAQLAFQFILSVLPKNMRTLLEGRYIANGGDARNSAQHAAELIQLAVVSHNPTVHHYDIRALKEDDGSGSGSGSGSGGKKANLSGLEVLALGTLGKITWNLTSTKFPNLSFTLHGVGGDLQDADGDHLAPAPMPVVLNNGLGGLIDNSQIYAGSQRIRMEQLEGVVYDGNGIIAVNMPVDANGNIDWDAVKEYNDILYRFENDPEQLKAAMAERGFEGTVDEHGNFKCTNGKFLKYYIVNAYTTTAILPDHKSNYYSEVLSHLSERRNWMEGIYDYYNKDLKGDAKYDPQIKTWLLFNRDIMSTPILMKASQTDKFDAATMSGNGPLVQSATLSLRMVIDNPTTQLPVPSSNVLIDKLN